MYTRTSPSAGGGKILFHHLLETLLIRHEESSITSLIFG